MTTVNHHDTVRLRAKRKAMNPTSTAPPITNASDVIRIGRRRSREASTAASKALLPSSRSFRANSTIRMAFFDAKPISTTRPIWK